MTSLTTPKGTSMDTWQWRRVRGALAGAAVLLVACGVLACGGGTGTRNAGDGGDGGGDDGSDVDSALPLTPAQELDALALGILRGVCEHHAACGGEANADVDACVERSTDVWLRHPWWMATRSSVELGYLAVDASHIDACLDILPTSPCAAPGEQWAIQQFVPGSPCVEVLIPQQTVGDPCVDLPIAPEAGPEDWPGLLPNPSSSCIDGYCAYDGNSCPGTCAAYAAISESCTDAPCDPRAARCTDGACVTLTDPPLALPGAACTGNACAFGYACVDNVCIPGRPNGDACAPAPAGPFCAIGESCVGGTCQSPLEWGDTCTDSGECGRDLWCSNNACRYPTRGTGMRCEVDTECTMGLVCSAVPGSGEKRCDGPAGLNDSCVAALCARGLFCLEPGKTCQANPTATGDACTLSSEDLCPAGTGCSSDHECIPLIATGDSCTGSRTCASGFCRPVTFEPLTPYYGEPGTCAPPQADGERCYSSRECESGQCRALSQGDPYTYCAGVGSWADGAGCGDDAQCESGHCGLVTVAPNTYSYRCAAPNLLEDGEACDRDSDCVSQCVHDPSAPSPNRCAPACPAMDRN